MPQKLNKAGKMQDYIPKGNGDASGEYGTSNGTNKNFTTSDKKKTEANVITENKSVVVGDKKNNEIKKQQERYLTPDEYKKVVEKAKELGKKTDDVVDEIYSLQDKYGYDVERALSSVKPNKANVVSNEDVSGKKDKEYNRIEKRHIEKSSAISKKELNDKEKEELIKSVKEKNSLMKNKKLGISTTKVNEDEYLYQVYQEK